MEMKQNEMLNLVKKSLLDLPTPTSISFMWNMGFMLGFMMTMQILTGFLISMLYVPNTEHAFLTMVMIMRDNMNGWSTRNLHMNGASLFFLLIYAHTARGIYYNSPNTQKKVWLSGMLLMVTAMATAFLGYVLPWGQMSFWGATVITGVFSAIPMVGNDLTTWIWGGPSINQPTLNRFFSMHFMIPMLMFVIVMIHLIMLHNKGSSNPTSTQTNMDKMKFNPLLTNKDTVSIILMMVMMFTILSVAPNMLGDVENFNLANPLVAPIHIQPEWYFLYAYVILRSIPSKLGGVAALGMSILILIILVPKKNKSTKFTFTKKTKFWVMISVFFVLTWIGTKTVEQPFESIGKVYTIVYFLSMMNM